MKSGKRPGLAAALAAIALAWWAAVAAAQQAHINLRDDVYACGGPAMIDAAKRDFTTLRGLPAEAFFADSFTYAAESEARAD